MTTSTRTQLRAVCPICFNQQAVRHGRMVQHGYTRPEGWHENNAPCAGAHLSHFGTVTGRDYAIQNARTLRESATTMRKHAKLLRGGKVSKITVRSQFKNAHGMYTFSDVTPSDPSWARHVEREAAVADGRARGYTSHAEYIEGMLSRWQLTAPIEVQVEKAAGPLIHWAGGYWKHGKACAGSAMGARKGIATQDRAIVTCAKCLDYIKRADAKVAAAK